MVLVVVIRIPDHDSRMLEKSGVRVKIEVLCLINTAKPRAKKVWHSALTVAGLRNDPSASCKALP